ncbi:MULTISPECIES: hypothetical protein [unclassified Spiroplasma]|uniref:hypothetical protein n=1 Tax=unclassified Spiroplasma TaxID=2637901 RepID=UPI00089DC699|nr:MULTISPECIES: hypothetical protein [unclassified Spiroplasma]
MYLKHRKNALIYKTKKLALIIFFISDYLNISYINNFIAREFFTKGDVDSLLELINGFKGDSLIPKQDKIQQVYNYIKRNKKQIDYFNIHGV